MVVSQRLPSLNPTTVMVVLLLGLWLLLGCDNTDDEADDGVAEIGPAQPAIVKMSVSKAEWPAQQKLYD